MTLHCCTSSSQHYEPLTSEKQIQLLTVSFLQIHICWNMTVSLGNVPDIPSSGMCWCSSPSQCWESLSQQQRDISQNDLNLWSMTGLLNLSKQETIRKTRQPHVGTQPQKAYRWLQFSSCCTHNHDPKRVLYIRLWLYAYKSQLKHNHEFFITQITATDNFHKLMMFFFNGYFPCTSLFFAWLCKSQMPNMITATTNS